MKSTRQRRQEIKTKRAQKRAKSVVKHRSRTLEGQVLVNSALLRPNNSYSIPDFVLRGYYLEMPFRCKDCGKEEVWTPTQQKWWYEIAKGDVFTTARRCRPCRRRERERKAAARNASLEGFARKQNRQEKES
jgi:hypothetical protein